VDFMELYWDLMPAYQVSLSWLILVSVGVDCMIFGMCSLGSTRGRRDVQARRSGKTSCRSPVGMRVVRSDAVTCSGGCQGIRLEEVEVKRVLFGMFPTYRGSPLKTDFSRILAVSIPRAPGLGGRPEVERPLGRSGTRAACSRPSRSGGSARPAGTSGG
jgi:hypothetical protein